MFGILTLSFSLSSASIIIVILLLFCLLIAVIIRKQSAPITSGNCLLLFAHPDDETMFFGPTIQNMNPKNLFALCVTSGNSDNLGQIRQEELKKAICQLEIPSKQLYFVDKEERDFRDGFTHKWDIKLLSQSIIQYLRRLNCQTLITFDNYGVSGHPNHIACYQAMQHIMDQWSQPNHPPQMFLLESVSIWRKYVSFVDVISSCLDYRWCYPNKIICVATPWRVLKAMREHKSQLVWFRYLYLVFSRYVIINTLRKLKVVKKKR